MHVHVPAKILRKQVANIIVSIWLSCSKQSGSYNRRARYADSIVAMFYQCKHLYTGWIMVHASQPSLFIPYAVVLVSIVTNTPSEEAATNCKYASTMANYCILVSYMPTGYYSTRVIPST